jgi:RimJ/RimL family protein N-acetyltransferase
MSPWTLYFGLGLLSHWALGLPAVARLEALVALGNDGSIRVLGGAGFRREGLLRAYFDLGAIRADALLYSLIQTDLGDLGH